MKNKISRFTSIIVLISLAFSFGSGGYFDVLAQATEPPTETPTISTPITPTTAVPTATSAVPTTAVPTTAVPTSTNTPLPFVRPQMVVKATATKGSVQTNAEFKLSIEFQNAGTATAYSTQAVLSSTDLVPLKNGGVSVLGTVDAGNNANLAQTFLVSGQIYGQQIVVVDLTLTYYDSSGASYSDKFTLSITATGGVSSGVAAATSTPTGVKSSQLVITGYSTDIDPLQPGEQFALKLNVQNVGNAKAQRITMIVGGGSGGTSGGTSGGRHSTTRRGFRRRR